MNKYWLLIDRYLCSTVDCRPKMFLNDLGMDSDDKDTVSIKLVSKNTMIMENFMFDEASDLQLIFAKIWNP